MGLTIHCKIEVPKNWTPETIRAKLEAARQYAKTLPVVSVSELAEFHGKDADFQHIRDSGQEETDPFFWAKIQGGRSLLNPWEPGSHGSQSPQHMQVFTVLPAEGSEDLNIGVCSYSQHVWKKAMPDFRNAKAWSLVFGKYNDYPAARKLMRTFMRRWKLRRLPKSKWSVSQRFGGAEKAFGCFFGQASIQRGRYLSHRKGYAGAFGLVTLRDRMDFELCFRFMGSAEEAEKVFSSAEFQADLNRMVTGEDNITPAVSGVWSSFCKTQYANDPRLGGFQNFVKAHLSVLGILEHMQGLGFTVTVDDEGEFWKTKDLGVLAKRIGQYDAFIAGMAGAFKDVAEAHGKKAESAMDGRPDFERLEMQGQQTIGAMLNKIRQAAA